MFLLQQFNLLAEYNYIMNQRQFKAATSLSEVELKEDKGAFFKSVLGTLNHIMLGDIIWLRRFATHPSSSRPLSYILELNSPVSLEAILYSDLSQLADEREKIDLTIINWIKCLTGDDINECITYTNMEGRLFNKPFASLINHLFQHQTHHRGQVTTLLSQLGVNFGETDLIEFIHECPA